MHHDSHRSAFAILTYSFSESSIQVSVWQEMPNLYDIRKSSMAGDLPFMYDIFVIYLSRKKSLSK